MTVQRQYTLPNCNLKLEGLAPGDETDPTAPITIVLNSECTFPGTRGALTGGSDFLKALVHAVNEYAQSILSGVPYPVAEEMRDSQPVVLQPTDNQRHQLTATSTTDSGEPTRTTIQLTSVQLFDLVESIDQLLADSQTLPDMTLQLSSLHRRHARPTEPASKRVVPAVTGISALAAAAALLFMVPVPEFEPTRPEREGLSAADTDAEPSLSGESVPPTESIEDETTSEIVTDTDTVVDPVQAGIALGRLSSAPAIADEETLAELGRDLETTLANNLPADTIFEESLVYRVAISEAGDILGYKYENDAALSLVDRTPLPDLTFIPVDSDAQIEEPIAQFRVSFEGDGEVVAEPISFADEPE
jgi:hypothetical protein